MIQLKLMMAADSIWATLSLWLSVLAGFHILLLDNFMSFFPEVGKFYELLLEPT
jgi:hypothetical protein